MDRFNCPTCGERYPFFTKERNQKAVCQVCGSHLIAPTLRMSAFYLLCQPTIAEIRAGRRQLRPSGALP